MLIASALLAFAPAQPLPLAPPPRAVQTWITELILKHVAPVTVVAASRDQIATADEAGTVVLWDARTGEKLQTVFDAKAKAAPVTRLQFSPDGEWLHLVTHGGKRLHVCECRKPKAIQVFASLDCKGPWTAIGFGQETPRWIFTPNQKSLWFHRVATDATAPAGAPDPIFAQRTIIHRDPIKHLAATDSLIVTVAGGELRGWPVARDPKAWAVTLLDIAPTGLALSFDSERVAIPCEDGEVRVFNAWNGQPRPRLRGHKAVVWAAAFSPDGTGIVTGSEDKTARVWELAAGKELAALRGHTAAVTAVAFTSDGKRIVTGSEDKTVRVWSRK